MIFKTFEPEDWPHFVKLARALHEESVFATDLPLKERGLLNALRHPQMWGVIAYEEEEPVGMCFAYVEHPYFSSALIANQHYFYVLPAHRGNGLGKELLEQFESWSRDQGVSEMWISQATGIETEKTREMFEHFNYETMGFIARKVI